MKKLYILGPIFDSVNYSYEIDSIITDAKEHDVSVLICDGHPDKCHSNTLGLRILCTECCKRTLSVLNDIPNIKILKSKDYYDSNNSYPYFNYSSVDEINTISYKGIEIGYGVSSYYISLTRNLNPKITLALKTILDKWLKVSMINTDIALNLITNKYDAVYVINGRYYDTKPFQDVAFSRGIHITLGESKKDINGNIVRMNFENSKVHSISGNCKAMEKFWDESNVPLNERIQIAESFFNKRAAAIATNDKVYAKGQTLGLLPDDWDETLTNIAIFNSSEDEVASIGDEWNKLKIFRTQLEGLKFIFENCKDKSIHFYIRIHPNLMNIKYKYHKDLYRFADIYPNVSVIPGNSPISSYTLMRACDRIVSFGSTMGVESAYAGKQVILMGSSFYYYLNINYVPSSKNDIIDFLKGKINFTPNHENTLKYSYYYYNGESKLADNTECRLSNYPIRIFGRVFNNHFMKLKCSKSRIKYCALLNLFSIFLIKLIIPTKEK